MPPLTYKSQYMKRAQKANPLQCRVTAHSAAAQEPANTIVPLIFALPYVILHPEYTFILDNGHGDCVGYCVAAPCSATYLERYKSEYLPTIDRSLYPPPPPSPGAVAGNEIERIGKNGDVAAALMQRLYYPDESVLHSKWPGLLEDYPAHLHIDILPEYQGHGGGKNLIAALLAKLQADRVRGIHLMKSGENKGAEVFYGRMGFERYPVIMDGGESGEIGRKTGGGVCMVQKSS
jgi:GNAT superfamily N-acetyltransferase